MAREELAFVPAWDLRERILKKDLSPVEVTDYFLRRIGQENGALNAFLTVCGEEAMAAARRAEAALARGDRLGPLHGIPVAIKDLNATKGIRTTLGSLVYKDWVPDRDDVVSERVRASGAIIVGKTNTPEFGHRGTTENRLGEPCRNPWDLTRVAGGSSGGAAAAIAAGLCPLATGSDGGGSIRIPAAFCGVFGIKPSHGRVPTRYPQTGGWGQFAQNGPITRTVRDAIMLLQVLSGPHPEDPRCIQGPPPDFAWALDANVRGFRVAWTPNYGYAPAEPEVRRQAEAAARSLTKLGAIVEEATPPISAERVLPVFRTIFQADYLANYGALLETHADLLDPLLRSWMEEARTWRADRVVMALHELEWHRHQMARFLERYDLLLSPTMPVPAFPLGQFPQSIGGESVDDPLWAFSPFTYPINMSGLPAASVPCGFSSEGLPLGLHVVGGLGQEVKVLRACVALEQTQPWVDKIPPGFATMPRRQT